MTKNTLSMLLEILEEMGHPCGDALDPTQVALATVGLDSLLTLEMLMIFEDRTGVEVPVESIERIATIGELVDLINCLSDG